MAKKDDGYVRFQCKQCGQRLKFKKDREGGDVVQCPRCAAAVNVPLANIEEIARSAQMPETGDPGRLNLDPALLMRRLRGEDDKPSGPGSMGGPPSLHEGRWSPTSFGRLTQLDQVIAAVSKIDQEVIGQIQKLYRERGITPQDRERQFEVIADRRRDEIQKLLSNRLFGFDREIKSMSGMRDRLDRSEQERLDMLERSYEAIKLYGRCVYGVDV